MTFPSKPQAKPARPEFSSGPYPKHPEWSFDAIAAKAFLGRSHRAAAPKAQLKAAIDRAKAKAAGEAVDEPSPLEKALASRFA